MTIETDKSAIEAVIQAYCDGTYKGDLGLLKSAFHPAAVMAGSLGGKQYFGTLCPFFNRIATMAPMADSEAAFSSAITFLEITGDTACVTLEEKGYFGMDITDYFHLLKQDGRWTIISKLYQESG